MGFYCLHLTFLSLFFIFRDAHEGDMFSSVFTWSKQEVNNNNTGMSELAQIELHDRLN